MKLKNQLIILFIFVFVSIGYAYDKGSGKEDTQAKKIIRNVDRKGAVQIAKDFLKDNDLQADYYLTKYIAKLKDGVWHVVFLKKGKYKEFGKVESIRIKIDQKTGKVIDHEEQDGYFIDGSFR